jgi:CDGSH-type Zn-finger protein
MPEDPAGVRAIPGGPLVVEGIGLGRLVRDDEGWSVETVETSDVYSLCRCGRSNTMPFCDRPERGDCFVEEPADGPDPRPFRWDVPDPEGAPALALKPDGPIRVAGEVAVRHAGEVFAAADGRLSLCRCGRSRCQPLCDSSHTAAGFRG